MKRTVELELEYQPYIPGLPGGGTVLDLRGQSTKADAVTIQAWAETWLNQTKINRERFGSFHDKSIGELYCKAERQPVIIAGAGPSLQFNGEHLKNKGDIPLLSCLHNFHYMEDRGIPVDYYVTLDAGEITIGEVSEGGEKTADEYWEISKDRTLLCFTATHPKLLEKWKGKILFFSAPLCDKAYMDRMAEISDGFNCPVSTGGNVLGACLYIAKAFMGANPVAFVGADFAFYNKKFHAWNSKYDLSMGQTVRAYDVFGNVCHTWPSYFGFKAHFEIVALSNPGLWINCSEGGILGAYADGNIQQILQIPLQTFLAQWKLHKHDRIKTACTNTRADLHKEMGLLF